MHRPTSGRPLTIPTTAQGATLRLPRLLTGAPRLAQGHTDRPAPTRPWWAEEATSSGLANPPCRPLVGTRKADITVVGGGYTGLWTAISLRRRDPRRTVAVVESQACGVGASGRNGGFVSGYWQHYAQYAALFGQRNAYDIGAFGSEAQEALRDFARSQPEDIGWRDTGTLICATSSAQERALDRMLDQSAGLPAEAAPHEVAIDESAVLRATSSESRRRVIRYPEGALIQPARLVWALKRHALELGVEIYESSPVIDVHGPSRQVRTTLGEITTDRVVLATNAWSAAIPHLRQHLTNLGSYALVTEPLPDLASQIRQEFAVKDARMFLHWVRTTVDDRLIVGTGAGPMSYGGRVDRVHDRYAPGAARVVNALYRFFPSLHDVQIDRVWGGPVNMSSDGLPHFGTLPDMPVHYGCGYSGHGVNATWLGGQILSSLALQEDDRWTASVFCRRRLPKLPPEPLRYVGGRAIHASALAVEDALDDGVRPLLTDRAVAGIPKLVRMRIGIR